MPRYITAQAGSGGPTGLQVRLSIVKADSHEQAEELALYHARKHFSHSEVWQGVAWPIQKLDSTIRPYPKHILLKGMTLKEVLREWWRQNHPREEVKQDG